MPLILASASATRLALLHAAGLPVEARPARIDEDSLKRAAHADGTPPGDTALLLATFKARRIQAPGAVVIAADQLLTCDDAWFDKPATRAEARAHLQHLRGQTHTLHTALVVHRDGAEIWRHLATPRLTMRPFSDAFLDAYLDTEGDAVLSSVGAYRLEGLGLQLMDRVDGEHTAILGLPMLPLLGFLRQHGALPT
ncbi:MAG: Maf family protein [Janthinobacterium lividum]